MAEPTLPKTRGAGGKSKTAARGADAAVQGGIPEAVEKAQAGAQPSLNGSPDTLTVGVQGQGSIRTATASPEELGRMISEAAYYRAEKRGFEPGYEMEDWIAAEIELNVRLDESSKAESVMFSGE
ncbi:MAG TPA: DUF2934 domain-containing protein [Burkholderiales bacterium]|nr:DUF2934 domain-containing protein [Burkholderiales bacterium]